LKVSILLFPSLKQNLKQGCQNCKWNNILVLNNCTHCSLILSRQ
jgi:hypothetical protein